MVGVTVKRREGDVTDQNQICHCWARLIFCFGRWTLDFFLGISHRIGV